MTIQSAIRTDNLATRHAGFARVFQPGRLTFGFIAPLEGYPDRPAPTMRDHLCRTAANRVLLNLRAARLGDWEACVPLAIRLRRCRTWPA